MIGMHRSRVRMEAPPTGFAVEAASSSVITLTWTDPTWSVHTLESIAVFVSTDGEYGTYSLVDVVDTGTETYDHEGMDPETEYWHYVRGFDSTGHNYYGARCVALGATTEAADPFTPSDLTGLKAAPVVELMQAANKLWQDLSMTIPASLADDPVLAFQCTFTGVTFIAPDSDSGGVLKDLGGGKWGIECNAATSFDSSVSLAGTVMTALNASQIATDFSSPYRNFSDAGEFAFFYIDPSNLMSIGRQGSTDECQYTWSGGTDWNQQTGVVDLTSGTTTTLRLNGTQKATKNTASTGGIALNGISVALAGISGFTGRFSGAIFCADSSGLSNDETQNAENYLANTMP